MISKEKLKEYAKLRNYNLGQAETDYFQEIILFILYQELGKELIFKGGTALTKCYGFDRFSQDLDFTVIIEKDFQKIISKGLKRYYLDFETKIKTFKDSINLIYKIKGPLYNGQPNSLCKTSLDFSTPEKVLIPPLIKRIGLYVEEIPSFDIIVMAEQEILAEKIRALITRNKARDLYDVYFLIKKGVKMDFNLINHKLSYYSIKFSSHSFKKALKLKEKIWSNELKYLTKNVPNFKEAINIVLKEMPKT